MFERHLLCCVLTLCLLPCMMQSADFSAIYNGKTLYYTITDNPNRKVKVCAQYSNEISYHQYWDEDKKPNGDIVIPATVSYNSTSYTVEGVDAYAFCNCSGITGVTFPTAATFTSIGSMAFFNCNISSLTIPNNVTTLGSECFRGNSYLETLSLGSGVTTIPSLGFSYCGFKHLELPNTVKELADRCFTSCKSLKYVDLGNNVSSIHAWALGRYSGDTEIDTIIIRTTTPPTISGGNMLDYTYNNALLFVPDGCVDAYKAASNWSKFKYVFKIGENPEFVTINITTNKENIPAGLENLTWLIDGAENLSEVKLLKGTNFVISINTNNRFYGLDSVAFCEEDVTTSFNANATATLTANADCTLELFFKQVKQPYDFTESIPSGQNLYFTITDEVNKTVKIVNQSGGRSLTGYVSTAFTDQSLSPKGDVIIPATIEHDGVVYSITEIDTLAFSYCSGITSLTLSEGLLEIGPNAFIGCGIGGELFIPMSCTKAGSWAFRDNQFTNVNTGGVEELTNLLFLSSPIKNLKISDKAKKIYGRFMKDNASLETIEIGENVESIESAAFYNCQNVISVTIYATTPPSISLFESLKPSNITLYVPQSKDHTVLNAYQSASGWSEFNIVEMPYKFEITVATQTLGTGNVSGAGKYEENTTAVLTPIPTAHYQFTQWTDGNTDNPRTITVTQDSTFTAIFKPIPTQIGETLSVVIGTKYFYFEVTNVSPNEMKLIKGDNYYNAFEGEITLPNTAKDYWNQTFNLTRIESDVLWSNTSITTLHIPEGVRVIEEQSIFSSSLEELFLPATIDTIYTQYVNHSENLTRIHFAGTENLTYMDMFYYSQTSPLWTNTPDNTWCVQDGVALFYKGTAPAHLDIPEGVSLIGKGVLAHANVDNLTSIRLSSTVQKIANDAFTDAPYDKCKTIYTRAQTPPAVLGEGLLPFHTLDEGYTLIVDCDADLNAYQNESKWAPMWNSTIQRKTYYVDFQYNDNTKGNATISPAPECGKVLLTANPIDHYHFAWWDGSATSPKEMELTADTTLTLNFYIDSFKIKFVNYNDTLLDSIFLPYNAMPEYGKSTPVRNANDTFTYAFNTWTPSISPVEDNTTYTAYYTPTYIDYTITFVNEDGTTLDNQTLHCGDVIYYNGPTPQKAQNDTFTYTFSNFNNNFVNGETTVTGNMTFTAQFTPTYIDYTIAFINENGTPLDTLYLHYGDVIHYVGQTPQKAQNDTFTYTFSGFDNKFVDNTTTVSGNIIYTAQFTPNYINYTILFLNFDGAVLDSQSLHYGETIHYNGIETPLKPDDEQYTYTFSHFDNNFANDVSTVIGKMTFTAQYTLTDIDYTILFVNYDSARLDSQVLHYGETIHYNGIETPLRPDDAQYTYTFSGFDKNFENGTTTVTGNMVFTAQYSTVKQKYAVIFLDSANGNKIDSIVVEYGDDATALAPHDSLFSHPDNKIFGGWSQPIDHIVEKTTVWPIWNDRMYTVIFIDTLAEDSVIARMDDIINHGSVTPPAAPEHEGYTFIGWSSDDYLNVTADLVIHAMYQTNTSALYINISDNKKYRKEIVNGELHIIQPDGSVYNAKGEKLENR